MTCETSKQPRQIRKLIMLCTYRRNVNKITENISQYIKNQPQKCRQKIENTEQKNKQHNIDVEQCSRAENYRKQRNRERAARRFDRILVRIRCRRAPRQATDVRLRYSINGPQNRGENQLGPPPFDNSGGFTIRRIPSHPRRAVLGRPRPSRGRVIRPLPTPSSSYRRCSRSP